MKQLGLDLSAPTQPRTAPLRSFHARSHVTVPEAQEGERRAAKQENEVLEWFREQDRFEVEAGGLVPRWTPSQVHARERFQKYPLTSIRRAISNLTARGLLRHHRDDRRPGLYGAKESVWSLA